MLIGTDRALFEQGSVVRTRITKLGVEFTEALDSVVLSAHRHGVTSPDELAPQVHAYPTNSFSRLLYGWDAFRIATKLPRPDIISSQDPFETGLVALLIARHFRVPFVIEVHTDFLAAAYRKHSLVNRLRVLLAGFVLRRAAGGYAVSNRVRDGLVKKYGKRVHIAVLPIFVNTSKFTALAREPKSGSCIWIGRLTEEKNPSLALEAIAHARARGHDVRLTLLGQGPLESHLRAHARQLRIESFVTFAGWQDPAKYLPETELMLVTSTYEGYGMALIEALAAGVPVLATDVGIAHEAGAIITPSETYPEGLLKWLEGPRSRGVLQLQGYPDQHAYLSRTAEFYTSHLTNSHL